MNRSVMLRLIFPVLIACSLAGRCPADIRPAPGTADISALFAKSAVVCRGQARSVTPESPAGNSIATVDIDKVYKSRSKMPAVVQIVFDQKRSSISAGDFILVFLTSGVDGSLSLADPFFGVEFVSRLSGAEAATASGESKLAFDLLAGTKDADRSMALNSLEVLQGIKSLPDPIRAELSQLARGPDKQIALRSLAALSRTNSPEVWSAIAEFIGKFTDTNLQGDPGVFTIALRVADVNNPDALPYLEKLSNSQQIAIRDGAIRAVRAMGSPKTVPFLIQKLSDNNTMVRFQVVSALAEITGKHEARPTLADFIQNQSKYVELWRKWWAEEGRNQFQ